MYALYYREVTRDVKTSGDQDPEEAATTSTPSP
jgi:hypothetical protein